MKKIILVVIPCYGSAPFLNELISSLLGQELMHGWLIHIALVDNGLDIASLDSLLHTNLFTLIRPSTNLMYLNSISYALATILHCDLVLLSNQDVVIDNSFLVESLRIYLSLGSSRAHNNIIMPTHKNLEGDIYCQGLSQKFGLYFCNVKEISALTPFIQSAIQIDYISGCFFMANPLFLREILSRIGPWWSLYLEDIAISIEAKLGGAMLLCATDCFITHDYSPVYSRVSKILHYLKSLFLLLRYRLFSCLQLRHLLGSDC